jgi:hypothetical protein
MEPREGAGAVVGLAGGQGLFGRRPGPEGHYGAPTVTGVLLRSARATGRPAPGTLRRERLCAGVGRGAELVGGKAGGAGGRGADLGAALGGGGAQRALVRVCACGGVAGNPGRGEAGVAARGAAAAAASAGGSAPTVLCERLSRARVIGPLVVPGPCPQRVAAGVTGQSGRHLAASGQGAQATPTPLGPAAGDAGGRAGDGVSGAAAAAPWHAGGPLGGGLYRSGVRAHRVGAQCGRGLVVWLARGE